LSLAELAARVALSSDPDDEKAGDADEDNTGDSDEAKAGNADKGKASEAGTDEGHDVLVQVDALGGVDSTESAKESVVAPNPEVEHAISAAGASDGGQPAADIQAGSDPAAAPSTDTAAVVEAQAALAPGQEAAAASGLETEAVAQAAASSDAASDQTVSATDQVVNANASRTGDGANT
jgi:hypothetical protein